MFFIDGLDLPFFLSKDELGEVGVQLTLLVDPLLLHVVPTFLLSDPQSAGNVITKVQTLLLCQVISWKTNTKMNLSHFYHTSLSVQRILWNIRPNVQNTEHLKSV